MIDMLREWVTQLLPFVRQHGAWAGPLCFVLAFAESLAVVSLIVPSTMILIGIGTLVGVSDLSFLEVWAGATIGAAIGDWVSYWIGRQFGSRIADMWPLSKTPGLLPRARAFLTRWGILGVGVGRFIGPLRAIVPLVAGMGEMPSLRFQIANWLSAVAWAFVVLAPGAFGARWLPHWLG